MANLYSMLHKFIDQYATIYTYANMRKESRTTEMQDSIEEMKEIVTKHIPDF